MDSSTASGSRLSTATLMLTNCGRPHARAAALHCPRKSRKASGVALAVGLTGGVFIAASGRGAGGGSGFFLRCRSFGGRRLRTWEKHKRLGDLGPGQARVPVKLV